MRSRAISSAGERFVHTEEVTGSIPVSPTEQGPVRIERTGPLCVAARCGAGPGNRRHRPGNPYRRPQVVVQTVPFSLKTAGGEYAPELAAVKPNDTALPPCAASVALYDSGVAITFRPDWTTFAFQ